MGLWNIRIVQLLFLFRVCVTITHNSLVGEQGQNVISERSTFNLTFDPPAINDLYEDQEQIVFINITCADTLRNVSLSVQAIDDDVAIVSRNAMIELDKEMCQDKIIMSPVVRGLRLGETRLMVRAHPSKHPPGEAAYTYTVHDDYRVLVLRQRRTVDVIFRYGIIVLAGLLYIGFGCKVDLQLIWRIGKKPVAPAIGFVCQFIIMPLLGFGLGQLFALEQSLAFGLLCIATSPGGGSSNVWVNLFDGDLDLSLTMTTVSTFAALGMMPMWIYLLGPFYLDTSRVGIPYVDIIRSILTVVLPCLVGIIIQKCLPKIGVRIARVTRPFSGIFVVYVLTFGTYVNWYMYEIMGTVPVVMGAACLLPLCAYCCGAAVAILCRRSKSEVATISIETGVQNATIPIILLQGSFPQPEGDLAAILPVATALFYNIPLLIAATVYYIHGRLHPKSDSKVTIEAEMQEDDYQFTESNDEKTASHNCSVSDLDNNAVNGAVYSISLTQVDLEPEDRSKTEMTYF